MLQMPEEYFAMAFGIEYFAESSKPPGMVRAWPFAALTPTSPVEAHRSMN